MESMMAGLTAELVAACPAVSVSPADRLAAAHDASHYLLTPLAVATPSSAQQVAALLAVCRARGLPVTFRSGGTSLSGQAGTAGLLVDTRRHFRSMEVLDAGRRVRTGPGATVGAVNARLSRHGTRLGPDPASEVACTIGGVIANNSSGMACGIEANAYRTLESAVLVLPSGTVLDTADVAAEDLLQQQEPEIQAGLVILRDRVRGNAESVARIKDLFAIKNTMGYGLNSFLDHDSPVDILQHLVIGSEGTLAFVAEATFRTVAVRPFAATGLLIFDRLADATRTLPALVAAGFATIELMDATSLRVAQQDPAAPSGLRDLRVETQTALLVEFQEASESALAARLAATAPVLGDLPLARPATLTANPALRSALWHTRKGLYAAVAGSRPPGTTALLEDIAVPVGRLYETTSGLTRLFDAHGYEDSVIFGHARDGNIHFMLSERFDCGGSLDRYKAFTEDMVALVLGQGGTLKAEHGTGRIMAPFVRRQYGDELYSVMRTLKSILDPSGILNPGVLLSDDPWAHVRDLKSNPAVEDEVDRCVECGYCEPACPSKDLTFTPRERIVLRREIARAGQSGDHALRHALETRYCYGGIETCAVDGMCQTACPVHINTGDLVRRLRAEQVGRVAEAGWKVAAKHWGGATRTLGLALSAARTVPAALPVAATTAARAVLGADRVPRYTPDLPAGGRRRPVLHAANPAVVYFASCTATMFGTEDGGVSGAFQRLCARAGIEISTPADLPALCCGTPWKSKGFTSGYEAMTTRVAASLRRATSDGAIPVVCDASSCTEGLRILLDAAQESRIQVIDAVSFADEHVLGRLPQPRRVGSAWVHPTCSSVRLGIVDALMRVAAAAATDVLVPDDCGCCAFAGDRGMLHPELTAAATSGEADQVRATSATAYVSLNRTCELGLSRATGKPYRHVLQLLDAATATPAVAGRAGDGR